MPTVAESRKYGLLSVSQAKKVVGHWLANFSLNHIVSLGLPEIDDRYHVWRVPLLHISNGERVGEAVIDARTSLIVAQKSTKPETLAARLITPPTAPMRRHKRTQDEYPISALRNTIACGDSEKILEEFPSGSIDLVFTSPPYYNARPEYTDYLTYEEYLLKLRKIIQSIHRILADGRFFVMNVSPVLLRRTNRTESSRRLAVPFDIHRLFIEEGYDFMEDIIWVKPEGAGWATGRGRRFAADRNPLQYKPVPVTEYILVYRKHSDKLIDWHIRSHPNRQIVQRSKIKDGYERTNIWKIKPAHNPLHPAIFPSELAEKVITYYSFVNDVVLDPFAGIGTVGAAAAKLQRRFVLVEQDNKYVDIIKQQSLAWLGKQAKDVLVLNSSPLDTSLLLF
jgi:DNA modification methylase